MPDDTSLHLSSQEKRSSIISTTLEPSLFRVGPEGEELPIAMVFNLKQREDPALGCKACTVRRLQFFLPNAIEVRPIIHLLGPLDDRERDHMLSRYPGTRCPGAR